LTNKWALIPDEGASYSKLTITNYKDPFDKMLIWQAINRDFILVGKDAHMGQYGQDSLKTLW
jgi:PIN domain nuclease of toxin-antitoxin system